MTRDTWRHRRQRGGSFPLHRISPSSASLLASVHRSVNMCQGHAAEGKDRARGRETLNILIRHKSGCLTHFAAGPISRGEEGGVGLWDQEVGAVGLWDREVGAVLERDRSGGAVLLFVLGAHPSPLKRRAQIDSKKKCSVTQDNLRSDGRWGEGGGKRAWVGINTD